MDPIVEEIASLRMLIDFAADVEDPALVKRCRRKIRALEKQLKTGSVA